MANEDDSVECFTWFRVRVLVERLTLRDGTYLVPLYLLSTLGQADGRWQFRGLLASVGWDRDG